MYKYYESYVQATRGVIPFLDDCCKKEGFKHDCEIKCHEEEDKDGGNPWIVVDVTGKIYVADGEEVSLDRQIKYQMDYERKDILTDDMCFQAQCLGGHFVFRMVEASRLRDSHSTQQA